MGTAALTASRGAVPRRRRRFWRESISLEPAQVVSFSNLLRRMRTMNQPLVTENSLPAGVGMVRRRPARRVGSARPPRLSDALCGPGTQAGQGGSKVRPVEGRSWSAALKSEDRRRVKSEGRRSKAERRPKPEGRRPKTEPRSASGFGLRISAFGLRASDFKVFGLRSSGFFRPSVFGSRVWNGPDRL